MGTSENYFSPDCKCNFTLLASNCHWLPIQVSICLIVRFEGGGGGQNGIEQYPTLSHIGGPFSLKETFVWFDFLLAALDCYTWSFGERLLAPSPVFTRECGEIYTCNTTSVMLTRLQLTYRKSVPFIFNNFRLVGETVIVIYGTRRYNFL